MNLSRVVVIVVVTAAIVYAGLNFLLPRGAKSSAAVAAAEAGFGTEVAAATPAAASETSSDAAAPAAESEAAAESPAMSEEEARAIAANVASEAAGDGAAADTGDAGTSGLTEEQRNAIAGNIAAEESGAAAEEVAPPPAEPAPEVAAAEPAPVEEAAPAPSPAPAAAPKPRKPAAPAKPAAAPSYQTNSGADVISAWWKKAGGSPDNLNLVYAGESTKDKAVVLIFDGEVDAAAAGSSIKLVDAKGASPSGSWSNGNNGRVLAFKGVPSGRYTVIIGAGLASSGGKSVGKEVVGPVYVH